MAMFLESGHDAEMLQIREALNTAQELTEFGAASLAHSLIILLESLADPILPDVVSHGPLQPIPAPMRPTGTAHSACPGGP